MTAHNVRKIKKTNLVKNDRYMFLLGDEIRGERNTRDDHRIKDVVTYSRWHGTMWHWGWSKAGSDALKSRVKTLLPGEFLV